ncbi:MAG TPA: lipid-A-disaccharide synthase [Nitrospirota bacterium]
MASSNKVLIVAGESSGDLHGANLAKELLKKRPSLELAGIGGLQMRNAGVNTLIDNRELAVVGLWEVLSHFSHIKRAFDTMTDILKNDPPALLVLIDYPDFNLRLAKVAKKAGVPVVYYISPQVWAWRKGRVKTIRKIVDKMLVVFPFEEEFYHESGVDCAFVGHPLLDAIGELPSHESLAARFGLDASRPILGLLPGSRRKEISFHLSLMLDSWKLIREQVPGIQAILPVADTLDIEDIRASISGLDDIKVVQHDTPGVMAVMDAAVVASGTATLQTALYGKPMVIIYKLSPVTYQIGKRLIKLPFIGIVNLLMNEEVVPELIQDDASPERISGLTSRIFKDREYRASVREKLERVREKLGGPGASGRAADEVLKIIGQAD